MSKHEDNQEEYSSTASEESSSYEEVDTPGSSAMVVSFKSKSVRKGKPSVLINSTKQPSNVPEERDRLKSRNSTGTLYMFHNLQAPDDEEIMLCLCQALYNEMTRPRSTPEETTPTTQSQLDIFNEILYPFGDNYDREKPIEFNDIRMFIKNIFSEFIAGFSASTFIMTASFVDTVIELTGLTMDNTNWRRITLAAILLATKIEHDNSVWNVDFLNCICESFPKLSLEDFNNLERIFLWCIRFKLTLTQSTYAKYYFELRSLRSCKYPPKPLDQQQAAQLEAKSQGIEERYKMSFIHERRARSLDPYVSASIHVSAEELNSLHRGELPLKNSRGKKPKSQNN